MATIEVHITAGDEKSSKVSCYGRNVDIINDEDRVNFKVTDVSIKDAIQSYYDARPDEVFFHGPTPWNLYKKYDWTPVTRTIVPQKCSIMDLDTRTTVLLSEIYNGNASIEEFESNIPRKIKNSVSSVWEKIGEVSAGHKTVYGFNMNGPNMLGSTQFSYVWKWGRGLRNSEQLTIGLDTKMNVTLNPNDTVVAELSLTKGVLKIRVEYEASLSGNLAVNYERKYRDHHFYAMNVVDVMKSVDLVPSVWSFEVIQLVYHYDSKVTFKNMKTNETLYSYALDVI